MLIENIKPFTIENNGITLKVECAEIKKGLTTGKIYMRPEFDLLNIKKLTSFFGEEILLTKACWPQIQRIVLASNTYLVNEQKKLTAVQFQKSLTDMFISLDPNKKNKSKKKQIKELTDKLTEISETGTLEEFKELTKKLKALQNENLPSIS